MTELSDRDLTHLRTCVDLARQALDSGSRPFGSILVDAAGTVLFQDHNHAGSGDPTQHPEFAIARWAVANVPPADRPRCVVYTSGEHCPMCSAAHAFVGLGRIVYAASTEQLLGWLTEWGVATGPVSPLPINAVAPGIEVAGPAPELADELRDLHARLHGVTA